MPVRSLHRQAVPAAPSAAPIVVIGASGGIGNGIVEALLESGIPVIAVARDGGRLALLRERMGADARLELVPGSIASDREGAELASVLGHGRRALGGMVVSVMGARERTRCVDQPVAALEATLHENLLPTLVAARHLVPLLVQAQRRLPFLVIGSPCADTPWAGYGPLSVSAAAQRMLVRVLHQELADRPVRVQQLTLGSPVRTAANSTCACPEWPSAIEVGRRVVAALADPHSNEAVVRLHPLPVAAAGVPGSA